MSRFQSHVVVGSLIVLLFPPISPSVEALDLVRDGRPMVSIVVSPEQTDTLKRRSRSGWNDRRAAEVLVNWVRKMTDAELPIVDQSPAGGSAIYVGKAAIEAGLTLDDLKSESNEGLRIRCDGRRLLLAGQNETATVKAVCRLLEKLGCRYFVDHPIGEVFERTDDLKVGRLDIAEQPGFAMRSIWGSQWSGSSLWKVWNGAGGIRFSTGHSWGNYVSKDLFKTHPEYFQFRDGSRRPSDWYCTSNRQLRKIFAQGVIDKIEAGATNPSISPPDGRGYCQCEACAKQDDPRLLEPSTGTVCVTNRYCDFYDEVAQIVGRRCPDATLSFYCYADYTQAPTSGVRLPSNTAAWIAPIRYCRYHPIGHPDCPSRTQLGELLDGWSESVSKIGYRTYNYNLAECCVPFSKISTWKHDIPYLKERGCIGINLETLTNWQIYGPHIYLSIRLAYDPSADADAIMDDFFLKFYGPAAGPMMKEYWMAIDQAFLDLKCHTGSFYALHLVYTPAFLKRCSSLLKQSAEAARSDKGYASRVAMATEGFENAKQYVAIREAMNRGDFQRAKRVYDSLLARSEKHQQTKLGNHYTVGYLKRFVGKHVEAGAALTESPSSVLKVLPDRWRLAYDEEDRGAELGYHSPSHDDSAWTEVATYSCPLDAQGIDDRQTIMWYRTTLDLPEKPAGKLQLFFTEVDGESTVFVNGREVGQGESRRTPFAVDVSGKLQKGENQITVRVDHSRMTELFLGGIIRPVVLVAAP